MNLLLKLAFLFFIGCVCGWGLEVVYRRYAPQNKARKWINPGFLAGPYLPLYGFGLCVMYLLAGCEPYLKISDPVLRKTLLLIIIAVCLTVLEYIAGVIFIKGMHVKLWDYSKRKLNVDGIICPLFSLIWGVIGAAYCLFIHPQILEALTWLSNNLAFSFFIGLFFGVFIIDLVYSMNMVAKIKVFADENKILVRYEELKMHIRQGLDETKEKYRFMFAFSTPSVVAKHFKSYADKEKSRMDGLKERVRNRD